MGVAAGNDETIAEEHAVAYLLLAIVCLAAGSVLYLVTLLIVVPDQTTRLAGPLSLLLVSGLAKYFHSRRKIRAATIVLGIGLWSEVTIMSVITGGLGAPALVLYPLIILTASWLLGMRHALAFAFMSVLVCVLLALAETWHLLPPVSNRPVMSLLIQSGVLIFTAVIANRIVRSYQARLGEVRHLTQQLDNRVTALASSETSYRDLFNTVNEAIYILDREGHFLDVNDGAVLMYGHPRERLIGHTPEYVSAPGRNDLARVRIMMERAFSGEQQHFEFWGLRANGEAFPKDVRLVRGNWFGQEVLIATANDITEQEKAKEEIHRLATDLERKVSTRTAELTEANRELESFAYSISHDLRAPLRGIDGFSHLLNEEYRDKIDSQGRDYLDRIRRAAQHMGSLIDDILDLSRVTRLELHRVSVDLSQLVEELVGELTRSKPESRAAVSVEPDCVAEGDPQLLRMMLQNLLENALKYSSRNVSPRIEFGCESTDGGKVYFVRDNGVGFDMKYADRLFAPFQRLHKPEEFEGNGVGLATVARIVRRHGGRVWAESVPNTETTFRFTLS